MRRIASTLVVVAFALIAVPAFAAPGPNDPGAGAQWGLSRMRTFESWATSRGGGIVVAVIDTGVDAKHPDLAAKVLKGRDFVDNDDDASDTKGHGTHVAGTIAAIAGNSLGVASVAPDARILPVRVLGSDGEGDPGEVAAGIDWAVARGARIINLSLAQDEALPAADDDLLRDTRVDRAIKTAARKGVAVVVAAGNNDKGGKPRTAYDATVGGVVVVGAATRGDKRAAYSNYGDGMDLLAPGGGSSLDPKACTSADWIVSTWWNPGSKRSDYGGGCGTSMAVAHVSGVVALLMARGYTAAGATHRIIETAFDLGPKGRDAETGAGRIDAFKAVGPPVPLPKHSVQGLIGVASAPNYVPASGRPEPHVAALGPRQAGTRPRGPAVTAAVFAIAAVTAAHVVNARRFFSSPATVPRA